MLLAIVSLAGLGLVARLVTAAGTITLYVDDNSTCTTACGSQAAPYRTIQAAIDDADNQLIAGSITGATVQVAAGNYPERLYIVPNVHVICESNATTTIDATGKGRSAVILAARTSGRERRDFSIENCKITGGIGEVRTTEGRIAGGGIFILGDAVVSNNVITGNVMAGAQQNWVGGGVYVGYGDPAILNNVITNNVVNPPPAGGNADALGIGGGVYVEGNGVGVVATHARIEGNVISGNAANGEVGTGGGVRVDGALGTVVARNVIQNNRSNNTAGGVMLYGTVSFTDNLVYGNSSLMFGGGIDTLEASARIINNTIVGNSLTQTVKPGGYNFASYGGALCIDTIFAQNGQTRIANNIVVGNTVAPLGITAGLRSDATFPIVSYTDLFGNLRLPSTSDNVGGDYTEAQVIGTSGNVSVDPRFAHAPPVIDVTIAAGTTTTVALIAAARYQVNQVLEYNNDGVARTITAVNTTTNILTFTPALAAASQAFRVVAGWGSSTDTTEDFRLASSSGLIDTGTNVPATGEPVSAIDLAGQPRVQDGNGDTIATVDPGAYEFSVPDIDGDGVPNALDCAPQVFSIQTPPGPVGGTLRVVPGANLTWTGIPQANVYNVYRGTVSAFPFHYTHTCFEIGSTDHVAQDPANPPVGSLFYYLVSGVNACAEGCLGVTAPPGACEIPNTSACGPVTGDDDSDTIANIDDNCPITPNQPQADQDRDGIGDACDNCVSVANTDQTDANSDGMGDACQDSDRDGYPFFNDCNDQNPAVHPGAIETCNGVDDDCDTQVDNNLGFSTCGVGICQRSVANCVGGQTQTCVPGTPGVETCNGLDDDCDGSTDENLGTITCGAGICQNTVQACLNGAPGVCTPGTPSPEVCNGLDDDCDTRVDNGFPDTDLDGMADCIDPDDDNDGVLDANDCAPLVNSVSAIPAEVSQTLKQTTGQPPGTFQFTRVAQANVHNVYRGTATVASSFPAGPVCQIPEIPGAGFVDASDPPVRSVFYYLITGTNRCGEGPAGFAPTSACAPQNLDRDADGVLDIDDDCPALANPTQADRDHDGRGDACDNCPDVPNPGQEDTDGNGTGDACGP